MVERKAGHIPDQLLFVEHPHVVTIGRNGHLHNILASPEMLSRAAVDVHETNRGGDVTYHGPGQIVGLSDFRFTRIGSAMYALYVNAIVSAISGMLAEYGIVAGPDPDAVGVWVRRREDRRHRSPYQPLDHFPRLRSQCRHRFELLPLHHPLRTLKTGYVDAGSGHRSRAPKPGDRATHSPSGRSF